MSMFFSPQGGSSSTGSSGINYISAYDAEDSSGGTTGWATYDDGAVAIPVDGTGGTVSATWAASATTPQRGSKSFLFTSGAQGEGVSYDFTLSEADKNKAIYVSFDWATTTYTTDDLVFYMYDGTTATKLTGSANNQRGTFVYFTGTATSLRFIIHQATANSFTAKFDNFKIGPDKIIDGPVITQWAAYTPTATGLGTIANVSAYWRRVNDNLEVKYSFDMGTGTATPANISIPANMTIDTSKIGASTVVGRYQVSAGTTWSGVLFKGGSSNTVLFYGADAASYPSGYNGNNFTAGATHGGFFSVPILEWANQTALLSTTEMMNQTIVAVYALSSSNANTAIADAGTGEIVDFDTKIIDTHNAVTTGAAWKFTAPKTGKYLVSSKLLWDNATNLSVAVLTLFVNTVQGKELGRTTTASLPGVPYIISLNKGDYIQIIAYQDDTSSAARNIYTADANRSWVSIEELPDFSVYSVYGQTELVESTAAPTTEWPITANHWGDITSISLSAGEWDICASLHTRNHDGALTGLNDLTLGISTTTGDASTGLTEGDNRVDIVIPATQYYSGHAVIPRYKVTVTTTTTYYMKGFSTYKTNLRLDGYKISARRIK